MSRCGYKKTYKQLLLSNIQKSNVALKKEVIKIAKPKKRKVVPLKSSFMLFAILGFLISIYIIENATWRITFLILFAVMFIASLVSMSKAPLEGTK